MSGADEVVIGELGGGDVGDDAAHDAADAEAAGEGAGVDAGDAEDVVLGEVGGEVGGGAEAGVDAGEFADGEAGDLDLGGLGVVEVDAGVADLRGGHDEDLPEVGRVGEGLLVAGHGGVEDDLGGLGDAAVDGAEGLAVENRAVLESEAGGTCHVGGFCHAERSVHCPRADEGGSRKQGAAVLVFRTTIHGHAVELRRGDLAGETVRVNGRTVSRSPMAGLGIGREHEFDVTDDQGRARHVLVMVESAPGVRGSLGLKLRMRVQVDGVDRALIDGQTLSEKTLGCCRNCGFSLDGLTAENGEIRCPECGRHTPAGEAARK